MNLQCTPMLSSVLYHALQNKQKLQAMSAICASSHALQNKQKLQAMSAMCASSHALQNKQKLAHLFDLRLFAGFA